MAADPSFNEINDFIDGLLAVDDPPSLLRSIPHPGLPQSFPLDHLSVEPSSQNPSNGRSPFHLVDVSLPAPVVVGGVVQGGLAKVGAGDLFFPSGSSTSDGLFSDPGTIRGNNSLSPGTESSSPLSDDSTDSSEAALKYINQILMEEDMEETPWFFSDQVALQSTEKLLYAALDGEHPRLPDQRLDFNLGRLLESPSGNDLHSWVDGSSVSSSNSVDPSLVHGAVGFDLDPATITDAYFRSPKDVAVAPDSLSGGIGNGGSLSRSDETGVSVTNIFGDRDSMEQFRKGLEEASKFLPSSSQLFRNMDNLNFVTDIRNENSAMPSYGSRVLKSHGRDDQGMEDDGRAKKLPATSVDEVELSDMFDKVLLCSPQDCSDDNFREDDLAKNSQMQGSKQKGGKSRGKKHNNKNNIDLRTLLVLCAQAVSGHDLRTANELLKQIQGHSAPLGDSSQRLAHYFANALEARMAGNGAQVASFFTSPTFKKTSAADILKALHAHLTASPFLKFPIFFGGYMIGERAANAKALHIIDFGIGFGFHWPILIQKLSERPGGPPRLRMTGIEFPVPGFRPAQRIEDTFRRLAKYCERFGVPFEYTAIPSADWSSIRIEDLKLRSGEMIAVNSISRLKNLLDETVEDNNPRDTVLDLIRRINPDIFVHSTVVGSYTAPFFMTRFRELLFHLSAWFDMFEATIPGDSPEREIIERELLGREIMNVVACEGAERIERPETHKQWQVRFARAGFKPIPLDAELMRKMRLRIHVWYHKDFVLDEDKNWMLLGWRGRIMAASACWVPS
ncbi:hypothetical protein MLD38_009651 [Melastoma candidum]|uniref:Uncharacterized protein n=1 Tax=Melastoma candidum TaxID=119954 RepID=A0ACB9RYS3_9MYRT|nr:hypothetical protein MLD38_009651 [Melastoma candidum]